MSAAGTYGVGSGLESGGRTGLFRSANWEQPPWGSTGAEIWVKQEGSAEVWENSTPRRRNSKCGSPESGTWWFLGIAGRPVGLEGREHGQEEGGDVAREAGRGLSLLGPVEIWMRGRHQGILIRECPFVLRSLCMLCGKRAQLCGRAVLSSNSGSSIYNLCDFGQLC